jgi:pimeloyl-ACP methyl ester carboxylesterase
MKSKSSKFIVLLSPFVFSFILACNQKNNSSVNEGRSTQAEQLTEGKELKPDSVSGYATVNGIRMYYEIHGSGQPLVLIHGGGSTIYTTFGKILPMLAKTYRVIAVELQAHGHTSDRNSPETFEQDADDVAELLKQLNIPKVDIFGFSNGGSTALQLAIRHPDKVNKLIAASAIYKRDGMHPWFWEFMKKGTFGDMPKEYKDAFLSINHDQAKLLNMHNKDQQRMLGFKDWKAEDIQSINAPAFIIVSDGDVVRPEHALEMARLLPHGRLAILPGSHGEFIGEILSPHPDSKIPELTVSMIEEFLNEPLPK